MIPRIRKGNDFKHIWPITWNGQPEDFSDATDITLTAKVYGQVKALTEGVDYHIDGGTVMIDFTPAICDITGTYTVELNYIKPSAEFTDGDRRSAVDVQAFQIVNTSAEANATEGVSLPSEAMAAYALKYDDLTDAQKDELRGKGITSIDLTGEVGDTKTYTITYADGATFDFLVTDGHTPILTFVGTVLYIDGVPQFDLKGETGNGIASVELTSTVGLVKTYTITFTDDTTTTFTVTDGSTPEITFQGTTIYVDGVAGPDLKGEAGRGITSVELLSTVGLAKTYRITFTDATTYDYVVTDGAAGTGATVVQTTGGSLVDVMSQKAVTDEIAQLAGEVNQKASHGYVSNPKTLKEVEDNPFVPLQMPAFYVYDPSKFRVQSVKSTHKLSGNFTHIKKYNAMATAVASRSFIVKTSDEKYSIASYNAGYTTRIIVIKNGTTIYDLSQASSTWWLNQGVIIQRTIVDFDSEKIIISYGVTNFEVPVTGLRDMKNTEFTDIDLGINSFNSACAYSVLIQGIPASDVDGSKIISYLNTPSTSNLVDVVAPKFRLSNVLFNFENGKVTFDYSTLSSLPTAGNTYTQHNQDTSYTSKMFNIDNIEQSQQDIFVRYSFDIDVENASVYFKNIPTTSFKRIRLINRETFAVIDIIENLYNNPFEVPVGKWNMVVSTVARRSYQFGLILGWGGCNSGAAMTIYQGYRIDPVSVVLSAYPRLASIEKAWCPYSKQFTSELVTDFSNDII